MMMAGGAHEGCVDLFSNLPSPFSDMELLTAVKIPTKRKLADSCLDDTYETPQKQPYSLSGASPDLGCVLDSSNLVSPDTVSYQSPSTELKNVRTQTKDTIAEVKSHLNLSSSSETSGARSDKNPPNGAGILSPERVIVNCGNGFDFDIDSILCLSPIICDKGRPTETTNNVKLCLCPRSYGPQNKPAIGSAQMATAGQHVEDGAKKEGKRVHFTNGVKIELEDDAGFLSGISRQTQRTGNGSSQPPSKLLPQDTSSSLVWKGKREVLAEGNPPSSPQPVSNDHTAIGQQPASLTLDGYRMTLNRPPLGPSPVVEALEGNADENIGAPMFESTICEGPFVRNMEYLGMGTQSDTPVSFCQLPTTELYTSFEDSMPLQVQVKSCVVRINNLGSCGTTSAPGEPSDLPTRPVVFKSLSEWNRKKQQYMDSVSRHMQENPGPAVMTELLNLMSCVAEQQNDKRWQHPSDLTKRNYQKRFRNMTPRMTLAEWKAQNSQSHQGFNAVPSSHP